MATLIEILLLKVESDVVGEILIDSGDSSHLACCFICYVTPLCRIRQMAHE
ncbi:hypothetical protein [Piscirickettsia litoralis]|uniref:hypothetical protein n=1 Tax=Piscirickettsia litoralis TaxID=1891921 RepID=UPI00130152A5|nr:hypothetical protein [Piscirickettsia litoralis]